MTNFSLYDINKIVDADYIDFASAKANGATVKTAGGKTLNCRGETAPCGNVCRRVENCRGKGATTKSASKSLNKAVGGITGLTDKSTLIEVRDDSKPITMDTGEAKKKAKDVTEGRTITTGSIAERDEKIAAVQAAKEKKKAGAAKVTEREAVNPGDGKFDPRYPEKRDSTNQDYVKSQDEKDIEKENRPPKRKKGEGDAASRKKAADSNVNERAEKNIPDEPGMRAQDKVAKQKQLDDRAIIQDLKAARLDQQKSFISTEERAAKRKAELEAKAKETAERKRKQKEVGDKPEAASGDKAEQARKAREANRELAEKRKAEIVEEQIKEQAKLTQAEKKRLAATNAIRTRNGLDPISEADYKKDLREADKTRIGADMRAPEPDSAVETNKKAEPKKEETKLSVDGAEKAKRIETRERDKARDTAKRRRELMDKKLDREERVGSLKSDTTEKKETKTEQVAREKAESAKAEQTKLDLGKKVNKQVLRTVPGARKEGQPMEDYDDKVFEWKARKAEELAKAYASEGVQLPYIEALKIVNEHVKSKKKK